MAQASSTSLPGFIRTPAERGNGRLGGANISIWQESLFDRRQLRNALEEYQLAGSLTVSKDIALSCLINSGKILLELGDYETAGVKLAAALQIDPNNSTALLLRQRAFNQERAAKTAKRVPTSRPATSSRSSCHASGLKGFARVLVRVISITSSSDAECCPPFAQPLR